MKKSKILIIFSVLIFLFSFASCAAAPEEPVENPIGEIIIEPAENSSVSSSSESAAESSVASSSASAAESSSASSSFAAEEEDSGYSALILVNPWNRIPEDYTVKLVTVQGKYKLDEKAAQSAIELVAAAKVADGTAAIAVALDLERSAVTHMYVASDKTHSVVRGDLNGLIRKLAHGVDQRVHVVACRVLGGIVRELYGLLAMPR